MFLVTAFWYAQATLSNFDGKRKHFPEESVANRNQTVLEEIWVSHEDHCLGKPLVSASIICAKHLGQLNRTDALTDI